MSDLKFKKNCFAESLLNMRRVFKARQEADLVSCPNTLKYRGRKFQGRVNGSEPLPAFVCK